jgi:HNH endonuclease/AP2 domain
MNIKPQGPIAVNEEDQHLLLKHRWGRDVCGYACRNASVSGKQFRVRLHRAIMQPIAGMFVDHVDGDVLNNRRENLRVCTRAQNRRNRRKISTPAVSRFIGIAWDQEKRRWQARISKAGVRRRLGRFASEEAAALAYDDAARELFGEFARLNFPRTGERAV